MNTNIFVVLGVLLVVIIGIWYWSVGQTNDEVVVVTPATTNGQPVTADPAQQMYTDTALGYTLTFPTALSTTKNMALYTVATNHTYTNQGETDVIPGAKFTIPESLTTGTNLSADTYVSVEHLTKPETCDAGTFLDVPDTAIKTLTEGDVTYSFASSSEAAAGNRYEEYVYVLPESEPCIAVRYMVHYTAIENYDTTTVKEFDRTRLFGTLDAIRTTLTLNQ